VPYIYTSFYEGRSCNNWMYVNGWVPEQQVAPVVDYFLKSKNAKTFFLVGNDYAFGRGMLDFTRKYIEQKGGKVVGEEYLPIDGSDWTSVISKLRAAKPDALVSATAGGAPNVSLAKQLKGAGLALPYGNLAIDEGTAKTMGDVASGMYMSASYLTGIDIPENTRSSRCDEEEVRRRPEDAQRAVGAAVRGLLPVQGRGREGRLDRCGQGGQGAGRGVVHRPARRGVDEQEPPHAAVDAPGPGAGRRIDQDPETFASVDPGAQCPNLK
jgi:hypothetical protein